MTSVSNIMASNNRGLNNKNNKQLQEVKEVIQNKSDADINKILEVFNNDVSKTINAFMSDGGKDALSKWASMKKKSNQQEKRPTPSNADEPEAATADESNSKTKSSPNKKSSNKKPQSSANNKSGSVVINDLVSSIINQSISTTGASTPTVQQQPSVQPTSLGAQIEQQQSILNNLNNLIIGGKPTQSKIGGLKVTVIGIEQPKDITVKAPVNNQPSLTSSPSSMSSTSTFEKDIKQVQATFQNTQSTTSNPKMTPNINTATIPNNNSINNNSNNSGNLPQHPLNSHINRSYINPNNTKNVLDKFQKDLQRQSQQLARISSQFHDELNKSQLNMNQTFMLLRNMLDQRQAQLQANLAEVSRNAAQTLNQRQHKANQLKVLAENVVHLNDSDTLELKADIKHFINERLLDEEFGKAKVFSEENYDQLHDAIGNYGHVVQLNHIKYATSRPPVEKVLDNSYSIAAVVPQQPQQLSNNSVSSSIRKNSNKAVKAKEMNGSAPNVPNGKHSVMIVDVDSFSDGDNEGEFIEVKKPQRNKNKQSNGGSQPNGATNNIQESQAIQQQPSKPQVNGAVNGQHQQQQPNGNGVANKKKKQKQNNTTPDSLKAIPKANQNPFALIANGQY